MSIDIDDLTGTVFICDNLHFLRGIPSESVDLVCIDPPFGKKQTFVGNLKRPLSKESLEIERGLMQSWGITDPDSAYDAGLEWPDQSGRTAKFREIWNFSRHVYAGWIEEIRELNPGLDLLIQSTRYTQGDHIAAYIAFMAERMFQIKRILKDTGSVYLHCDDEANAYLRQMMDAVFGSAQFRNEIIWKRTERGFKGSQFAPKAYNRNTDTILFYGKSDRAHFDMSRVLEPYDGDYLKQAFKLQDDKGAYYRDQPFRRPGAGPRPNLCYWYKGFYPPNPSGWQMTKERLEELDARGDLEIVGGKIYRKIRPTDGKIRNNLWVDIPEVKGVEETGYPTQKPQALARRIIEASCPENGIVLDCFAGCAYVPVAAQLAGRRWIACDMSPRAWTVIREQFHKHPDLGVLTEGEMAPDPRSPGLYAELQMLGKIIRVRGPYQVPPPVGDAAQSYMKGVTRLDEPKYRVRAAETSGEIWDAFVAEWGTGCWYCGQVKGQDRRELQLDHVEPKASDGSNDDCWNRALACSPCNSDKGNRLTPRQTIERARVEGRIATDALMEEQVMAFGRRMAWARTRWEIEIKPGRLAEV